MRVFLQRVSRAAVHIDGELAGSCGRGLLLLLGVCQGDSQAEADYLVEKCLNLRVFSDAEGKMNLSLLDIGGEALVISQFTLYADTRRGRRPSFSEAAAPTLSEPLYEYFVGQLRECGKIKVACGRFGADMQVSLVNDGPVSIMLEKNA
ncbi:MAG: D-aminoacyl-tRNA deacylase [Lentisphaeria bacterium]|jgi:D-tyrosyl-tRNA(Tyr) deacylase|nr:D-aminoacyl-tRNA deacylase [Lentisphaeria bacterium]NLZ60739.1 D-tyrosyl-tRNA(Tyr) deacylase [Lentisphaerota bacterium]